MEGHPKTDVIPENIAAVRKSMQEDPRITVYEIQKTLNIRKGCTIKMLKNNLGVVKRCSRWIPHTDNAFAHSSETAHT